MSDNVQRAGETLKNHAVAIAIHHLLAVPERIVVLLTEMNRGNERLPMIVDRLASKYVIIKTPGGTGIVESLVHCLVTVGFRVGFRARKITRQIIGALAIKHLAAEAFALSRRGRRRPRAELGAESHEALG
jgi:hypothetical protein